MPIDEARNPVTRGTFPGPSRTITVEPIQVPTAPAVMPTAPPQPVPERHETDAPREPLPVQ